MNLQTDEVLNIVSAVKRYDSTISKEHREALRYYHGVDFYHDICVGYSMRVTITQEDNLQITIILDDYQRNDTES